MQAGSGYYVYSSWDDFVNNRAPAAFGVTYSNTGDLQFVRFLQDLFAIAKTHNRRQQTADFDILFQRITMA